jgi:hypothetical protein
MFKYFRFPWPTNYSLAITTSGTNPGRWMFDTVKLDLKGLRILSPANQAEKPGRYKLDSGVGSMGVAVLLVKGLCCRLCC